VRESMTLAAERPTWQNPRIFSTLLLVFLAGATAGAVSMKLGLHQVLHPPAPTPASVLQKFRTDLDLTPAQAQKISVILDDYLQYFQSVQEQQKENRATGRMRILQELNPSQREKFQKMMGEIPPQLAPKP